MKRCFAIFLIGLMNVPIFSLSGCHKFGTRQEATGDDLRTSPKGMVLIPAGEFQMGSNDDDDDEKPMHSVYVDAFYMDKHEVTNAQYKRFIDANPTWRKDRIDPKFHDGNYLNLWSGNNYPQGGGDDSVVYVSWYAAMAYSVWAGKRLPTEAEWEKATEAGMYYIGRDLWEWCLDAYDRDFYVHSPNRNPLAGGRSIKWLLDNATEIHSDRALRGGGWFRNTEYIRASRRDSAASTRASVDIGFRCVWSVTDGVSAGQCSNR